MDTLSTESGPDREFVGKTWAAMSAIPTLRDALTEFVRQIDTFADRLQDDDLLAVAFEQPVLAPKPGQFLIYSVLNNCA